MKEHEKITDEFSKNSKICMVHALYFHGTGFSYLILTLKCMN